jgi:hypothetical protein
MNVRLAAAATLYAAALCTGCSDTPPVELYQSRLIDCPAPVEVLRAAADELRTDFGRVSVDEAALRIETQPAEFVSNRQTGSARDLVGVKSTLRRTARFVAQPRGGQTLARVRIDVERLDITRDAFLVQSEDRLSDRPNLTPIERDAATSAEQNRHWTRVRRDSQLERALLDALDQRFAARATSTAPAAPQD